MPDVSVAAILEYLDDRVRWIAGSYEAGEVLEGVRPIDPGQPGRLSFFELADDFASDWVPSSLSRMILVRPSFDRALAADRQLLVGVQEPRREFVRVTREFFHPDPPRRGVHPTAVIDEDVLIGQDCEIGPGAHLEAGVRIGDRCRVGANVVLISGTRIGDDVVVGSNTTIGEAGFGYVREPDGEPILIPHLGGVVIESDVEIGANTTIDRGTLDDTVIRRFAKIDNLVHIAHNCEIGQGAFIIATASVSGSVRVGPMAWVSPNSTISQHLTVGADSVVGIASSVLKSVPDGHTVFGNPARTVAKPSPSE